MTSASASDLVRALTTTTPDFPTPGILFRDLSPVFADGAAFRTVVDGLAEPFAGEFDAVAGAEARGFLFAAAMAHAAGVGVLPLRKPGKLPPPVISETYDLEYGSAELQLRDTTPQGLRVLLVDDVLATGGTLAAARRLLEKAGNTVVGASVVIELAALGGRATVPGLRVAALDVVPD
ncbi:adenine phosphoribosyltransferase [Naasia sp. SYSU D00057]|uniref:adenine phosphoribosyltransferase n=1 Tax=Naasia sp. SYSU D00057 TaxID=2817380 RepID=UPI001B307CD5|nr:adenine phosphoribosyltransferase [Naasia sp. SYSU D00057]